MVARQGYNSNGNVEQVDWENWDAAGTSLRYTTTGTSGTLSQPAEMNATGNDVGTYKPLVTTFPPKDGSSPNDPVSAFALLDAGGCVVDGIETACSNVGANSARQCPNNDCSARREDGAWVVWGFTKIKDTRKPPTLKQARKRPATLPGPEDDEPKIYGASRLNPWAQRQEDDIFQKILLIANRVQLIGFSQEQIQKIVEGIIPLAFHKPCEDAFRLVGLPTFIERLKEYPLVIANANILTDSSGAHDLTGANAWDVGRLMNWKEYYDNSPELAFDKPFKGKNFMFLKEDIAFTETGIPDRNIERFGVTLAHAAMHTSGAGHNYNGWFWNPGHDLTSFENYQGVIDNCAIPLKNIQN